MPRWRRWPLVLGIAGWVLRGTCDPSTLVLVRCEEDIRWLEDYNCTASTIVYEKCGRTDGPGHHVPVPNLGRESGTYLEHILRHYDDLADWTVFSQAGGPTYGYFGHRRGGGHLMRNVHFDDYCAPPGDEDRFFVFTGILTLRGGAAYQCVREGYGEPYRPAAEGEDLHAMMCGAVSEWRAWYGLPPWFYNMIAALQLEQDAPLAGFDPDATFRLFDIAPAENMVFFAQGARFGLSRRAIRARPRAYYERLLSHLQHPDPWAGYYLEWLWWYAVGGTPAPCGFEAEVAGNFGSWRAATAGRPAALLEASGASGVSGMADPPSELCPAQAIAHGYVEGSDPTAAGWLPQSPVATKLLVACEPGCVLQGSGVIVCGSFGQWVPDPATLCAKTCGDFVAPHTETIRGPVLGRQVVPTQCAPGYVQTQEPYAVCSVDGWWTSTSTCELGFCSTPGPAAGFHHVNLTQWPAEFVAYMDYVDVTCMPGFVLRGSSRIYCPSTLQFPPVACEPYDVLQVDMELTVGYTPDALPDIERAAAAVAGVDGTQVTLAVTPSGYGNSSNATAILRILNISDFGAAVLNDAALSQALTDPADGPVRFLGSPFVDPAAVDCVWGDWTEWDCNATCGRGRAQRVRVRASVEMNGGTCPGGSTELAAGECNTEPCVPKDCVWEDWQDWRCTVSCAGGRPVRSRVVAVAATNGGVCNGSDTEWAAAPAACNTQPCDPVDCEWATWEDWHCDAPCGVGRLLRTRTKAVVEVDGGTCGGDPQEVAEGPCNTDPCGLDCVWEPWSPWACNASCGGEGMLRRERTKAVTETFGGSCLGPSIVRSGNCTEPPCGSDDCVWDDWQEWQCSASCGGGTPTRVRAKLVAEGPAGSCLGGSEEVGPAPCNTADCAELVAEAGCALGPELGSPAADPLPQLTDAQLQAGAAAGKGGVVCAEAAGGTTYFIALPLANPLTVETSPGVDLTITDWGSATAWAAVTVHPPALAPLRLVVPAGLVVGRLLFLITIVRSTAALLGAAATVANRQPLRLALHSGDPPLVVVFSSVYPTGRVIQADGAHPLQAIGGSIETYATASLITVPSTSTLAGFAASSGGSGALLGSLALLAVPVAFAAGLGWGYLRLRQRSLEPHLSGAVDVGPYDTGVRPTPIGTPTPSTPFGVLGTYPSTPVAYHFPPTPSSELCGRDAVVGRVVSDDPEIADSDCEEDTSFSERGMKRYGRPAPSLRYWADLESDPHPTPCRPPLSPPSCASVWGTYPSTPLTFGASVTPSPIVPRYGWVGSAVCRVVPIADDPEASYTRPDLTMAGARRHADVWDAGVWPSSAGPSSPTTPFLAPGTYPSTPLSVDAPALPFYSGAYALGAGVATGRITAVEVGLGTPGLPPLSPLAPL